MKTGFVGAALAVTAVAFLLGAGVLLNENLRAQEQKFRADLRLEIFLRDDTTQDELRDLRNQVMRLAGYESSNYRDKTEAYAQMQGALGSQLLPAGGLNPFPNSLVVTFAPRYAFFQTFLDAETSLKSVRCVEGIRYPKAALLSQEGTYSFFRKTSTLLLLLVAVALFLVVWIGMRRIATARREEFRVLALLGAGWKQIGFTLIGKGLLLAGVSAAAGVLLLYVVWQMSLKLSLQLTFISLNGIVLVLACALTSAILSGLLAARSHIK